MNAWQRKEQIGEATLYLGDALICLREMPSESVHCIVTSPPYWGLRNYDVDGQIGLEKTPEEYIAKMVEVFREARRVLRKDGTCWANWGDSYAGGGRAGSNPEYMGKHKMFGKDGWDPGVFGLPQAVPVGLKSKDLCGIPWRVAFALQADGWYLRSDIIWAKPNPMPESVTDRPTKAHEYLFLLSKSPRYFYDAEAIKEQGSKMSGGWQIRSAKGNRAHGNSELAQGKGLGGVGLANIDRNRRTVWTIATQPFPEAHFATFPEKLVEPCVLAGCPAQVCPECGAPWERMVERGELVGKCRGGNYSKDKWAEVDAVGQNRMKSNNEFQPGMQYERHTLGFRPTCSCSREDTVPGTMLDPFCGAGTALLVGLRLNRRVIGIELKPEYMDMTRKRIAEEAAQGKLI